MRFIFVFLNFVLVFNLVHFCPIESSYCTGKPDPNHPANLNAVWDSDPLFVREVKNGKLFTVGNNENLIKVVHLYGTPYDWGLAQGNLLGDEIKNVTMSMTHWAEKKIEGELHNLPPDIQKLVAHFGLEAAIDLVISSTSYFTGEWWYEEIRGLADAIPDLSFDQILRFHIIPELSGFHCSMVGAWGESTSNQGLIQVRALDWAINAPVRNFPQITVYHPVAKSEEEVISFANVGWTGFIGTVSGMNSQKISICEIGVSHPDDTFGKQSIVGIPFVFLLRDILKIDNSLKNAVTHIVNSNRTVNLILGVGDGKEHSFRSIQYSASVANVFDDTNMLPFNESWHPRMKDVVYYGMDWLCPGYDIALHSQLEKFYGDINPDNIMKYILPLVQTGNQHAVIYDYRNDGFNLYVTNVKTDYESGPQPAYDRKWIKLDMNKIFNVK